ncbi:MAG TPA: putative holin [Mycobacterium sp.]
MIPLPRPWLLASAMLIGSAVGLLAGVAFTVVVHARIRPDVAIALVVGIPSVIGLLTILFSGRRWVTMAGAFMLALAPGWFGVLVALRVASGA